MSATPERPLIIDGLQYAKWSRAIFEQMHRGEVSAVHVTIAYWESTREVLHNIGAWNRLFDETMAALKFDVLGEQLNLEATLHLLSDTDETKRAAAFGGPGYWCCRSIRHSR